MQYLFKKENRFKLFLFGIFLINLLQAAFTPIIGDEAYYWLYSQYIDWGYFDHPPAVAVLISCSKFLFSDALSIRFFTVVFSMLTATLIWQLIPTKDRNQPKSISLYFILLLAIPGFHLYGFITTPDVPLLFCFTFYLWSLERLHLENNWKHALLLGVAAALLLYSKYHGAIFILLTILLRLNLLKSLTIYFAGLVALTLFLPHLYWQYQHDFITFNYHLFQRTDGGFEIAHLGNYLIGSLGILNPILIILTIGFIVKKQIDFSFYSKLFLAILAFFFLYSFRSKIEAHWVVAAFIPMVLVLHKFGLQSKKNLQLLQGFGILSIVLIGFVRIGILLPINIASEFHVEHKEYYKAIAKEAAGKNVVFVNSYQKASKYQFYTHNKATSYNNDWYRKNQYDLLPVEDQFHNQTVYMVGDYPSPFFDSIYLDNGEAFLGAVVENFPVVTNLEATIQTDFTNLAKNKKQNIELSIFNPYSYQIDFNNSNHPLELSILFMNDNERYCLPLDEYLDQFPSEEGIVIKSTFTTDNIIKGEFDAWVVIRPKGLYYQKISKKYKVTVE